MQTTPGKARYLSDLSESMGVGLRRCYEIVVPVKPSEKNCVVHHNTIRALVRHSLVEERRDSRLRVRWWPTELGLRILGAEEPRLLAAASDALYTSEPGRQMFPDAGEAVSEVWTKRFADEAVGAARVRALQRPLVWRLERALVAAQAAGVDVTRELLAVERRVSAIQRKAEQRKAA